MVTFVIFTNTIKRQGVFLRTNAGVFRWIKVKFTRRDLLVTSAFAVLFMAVTVLVFLITEALIPTAETIIRDVGVDLVAVQIVVVGSAGKAGIGGDDHAILEDIFPDA